jgi:hypothetical protein
MHYSFGVSCSAQSTRSGHPTADGGFLTRDVTANQTLQQDAARRQRCWIPTANEHHSGKNTERRRRSSPWRGWRGSAAHKRLRIASRCDSTKSWVDRVDSGSSPDLCCRAKVRGLAHRGSLLAPQAGSGGSRWWGADSALFRRFATKADLFHGAFVDPFGEYFGNCRRK